MTSPHRLLTTLSEAALTQAFTRFMVLRPFLEAGVSLPCVATATGIPLRTLRRWVQRYRAGGVASLSRKPRGDAGVRRRLHADLVTLIEGLALQRPAPSARYVHAQACRIAEQQGWPVPSYSSVTAVIRQLDPALMALAHYGSRRYAEVFDMIYRREANHPNELWQADHTLLDVWLWDDRQRPARPWLTIILDDYSRAIAGYRVSFQAPSALTTALTLREAIWRKAEPHWHVCGIPDLFYTDHGSDFTSQHLEQVSADLHMHLVFSQVAVPRGRGRIERFFHTVNQRWLCQIPGYTPAGQPAPPPSLTLPEFEVRLQAFLLTDYQLSPHSATGCAPQARWDAHGFLPRLPDSLDELDLLLLTVAKPRRVHQDGIRFQGLRYLDVTLAAYIGEDVTIRYDPRDMAEIRVFHQNHFVCRAVCQDIAHQTISLKEIVRARNERRRQLHTGLNDRAAVVERLLAVHDAPADALPEEPATAETSPRLKRYYNE